jgi:hypothetical protein
MNTTLALAIGAGALGWIALAITLVKLSSARTGFAQRVALASMLRERYDAGLRALEEAHAAAKGELALAERRIAALTLVDRPLLDRALALTKEADAQADVTGEWKRHQVYASLIDEFPDRRRRDLAYAIELALR